MNGDAVQPDHGVTFRHSGWARNRGLIYASLLRNGFSDARVRRFRECGAHAWILRDPNDPNRLRVAASKCHDRFCRPCANERARCIAANVHRHVGERRHRFVTLTVRSTDRPLRNSLDHLYACFRRLRQTRWWRDRVRGGAAFCELAYNTDRAQWHPHLHLLIDSDWLDQSQLSGAWHHVTGDSFVVDVRLVRQSVHAVRYVTKYASKPLPNKIHNRPLVLDQAVGALVGRRLILTFGTWRGFRLHEVDDSTPWVAICSLTALVAARDAHEPWALSLWPSVQELFRCNLAESTPRSPPPDATPSLFP